MSEHNHTTTTTTQMNRRGFMKTVGAGAGTVAVGASGVGPVPSPVGDSEALIPALAAIVGGVGVAGALGAFVESKYNVLGSDAPPDSIGPEALKDQLLQTAKTRKSTNASTLTDNRNIITYVKEPAFVSGKIAAVEAINAEKTKSEVESAAVNGANSHIATVEKNLLNSWEESVSEFQTMINNASNAGITVGQDGFIGMGTADTGEIVFGATTENISITLSDGSSFDVTEIHRTNFDYHWSPVSEKSGERGPLKARVGGIDSSTKLAYLRSDDWGNTWSELQSVQNNVKNNLITWVDTAYNQVQQGQLNPNNLLNPSDLADEYAGENTRAIADLQALNIPNAGGNEARIKVSDQYDSEMTGLLASSDGTISNLSAGDTVDPSAVSGDMYISHNLGKWTADVSHYYDDSFGLQGGEIRANRNPQYHYGNKSKGVVHLVKTSQGEMAEVATSDFTEKMDENNNPYWSVNISDQLTQSTADIAEVSAVVGDDLAGTYRTEQLTDQFEVLETSAGEITFEPPREPQTDSNYLTEEEWQDLEDKTRENIENWETSQTPSLPGLGDVGSSVRRWVLVVGAAVLGIFALNAASG